MPWFRQPALASWPIVNSFLIVKNRLLAFLFLLLSSSAWSYSVLTHEAVVDSSWHKVIVPLLQQRFPSVTEDELMHARKFAYGGCLIQDLGYYPFGNKLFSDLLHYVRSGDFITALIQHSQNPDEYAFSLAALSHYASDNHGHSIATNRAVPILYPDLRKKYGDEVTFEEKPSAHLKVEFGYDVVQVARGNYLSDQYHDFIGFDVPAHLLENAFQQTYGFPLRELIPELDVAIRTYRNAITGLIPRATRIAWELNKDDIQQTGRTREKFVFRFSRSEFEKEFGTKYKAPGFFSKLIAFFVRILPKIGPLKILAFKVPTPEVENMFLRSFERTLQNFNTLATAPNRQGLGNLNLDTAEPTLAGRYEKADDAYEKLLTILEKRKFQGLSEDVKRNILHYYSDPSNVREPRRGTDDYAELLGRLEALRVVNTVDKVPPAEVSNTTRAPSD